MYFRKLPLLFLLYQEKLAHTIHQNLLPLMPDCNMAIQDIYTLFIQDDSISDAKKKNLTPLYKPASSRLLFLAKLISFGMKRQFIKRNTKNQKLLAGGALSQCHQLKSRNLDN